MTALELLSSKPDLVILDLGLPDIDGLELLKMIRHRQEALPVVVLSSRGDEAGKVAREEANADVMLGIDTGCITTLDKNQWIGKAHGQNYSVSIMADIQFAALACGADPFKIVQLQWHASPCEEVVEKMGVSWSESKRRFEAYLKEVEAGRIEYLYEPELALSK